MKKKSIAVALCLCLLCSLVLALTACSSEEGFSTFGGEPEFSDPEYVRTPPPVEMAGYTGTNQEQKEEDDRKAIINLSNVSKGYVTAHCTAPVRVKFRVEKVSGEVDGPTDKVDYDLDNTGKYEVFPLSMGNGEYSFTVFINLQGNEYMGFLTAEATVTLEDEFAPFLVPNKIVEYTPESPVVSFSWELTQHAQNNLEVVQQVYHWVENNVTYDTDKANRLRNASGYLPDVEDTLATQTGICYDYAALVAAMLRANGIPCKLVVGDVSLEQGTVYHAWNMIWLEETGWIAVKIPTTPEEWERIDLTFAASKDPAIGEFIGDGKNYIDMYVY